MRSSTALLAAITLAGCTHSWEAERSVTRVSASLQKDGLAGTLIVLNRAESSASLLECGTGREVRKLMTGAGPCEVAISPDGSIAVVANYGSSAEPGRSLTVIDVAGGRVADTIGLEPYERPHGIRFHPDGRRVLVTAEAQGAVLIVDVATGTVEASISTEQSGSRMLALSPDGSRAFVANQGSGSVSVLDVEARKIVATIETGEGAEGLDVSPDGREVWVANRAADTVCVIDAEALQVAGTIACAESPIRLKFTPDGRHVLVANARSGDVAVFDASARSEVRRIAIPPRPPLDAEEQIARTWGVRPYPVGILVGPDGHTAYVASANDDLVTVLDLHRWRDGGRMATGDEPEGLGYSALSQVRRPGTPPGQGSPP